MTGVLVFHRSTADQARTWGFVVPSINGNVMVNPVDLQCSWEDQGRSKLRRMETVRLRFDVHIMTSEYLMDVDRVYKSRMSEVVSQLHEG